MCRLKSDRLTKLSPIIIEIQNMTLFNNLLSRNNGILCIMTIGICNIISMNPYPLNFLVMQPMTSSCATAEMKKVIPVATGRESLTPREAL